ncbi:hypothetical protein TELCIR_01873 [Teladorsagia circumcincta]|uniref:Uncharacterized protein n=1 Tax=Teladorsagia circumcincta TaxID=45464 RepID=A0A2G9V0Q6_TELCI|nr:hypothetical protein TELCIR_01873 [Teladorsagia circumcincta]
MGMFLGMSLLTLIEVLLYCSKVGWITFSKKRRDYMYRKRAQEKEHEKQLEETVTSFKMFRSRKTGARGKIAPLDYCDSSPTVGTIRFRSLHAQSRSSLMRDLFSKFPRTWGISRSLLKRRFR